ncbi:hypothetical protein MSC49_39970 (plasmid) [Methylosinus sp. C49]|uniref:hypothetical protein n=1 Tax=Methylosinus sp. C49 TaxID=2699395 RepID=UPI0013668632|nr:hypothetical protein [Methylosinus sp. C49]BBU64062.1 hypothetical protein MSC49_39970 [Methylosinus sp. C49]
MQVYNSNNQYLFFQQRASAKSTNSSGNGGQDAFATVSSNSTATPQQLRSGYFGSPRATLEAVLAAGGVVNTLSFLTSSDIDLIQRTTGVTIKNGGYYDSDGNQLGIHSDSHGNLLDPNPSQSKAAFDLANTLSDLRNSGGPQGDTSLQNGRKVTVDDLEAYLKGYAAAKASGQSDVYVPNADVIKQAEKMLTSEQS